MFKDNSAEPHLAFTVSPVPSESFASVSVSLDGEVIRSRAGGNVEIVQISWPGGAQHEAKLSAALGTGAELAMVGPYSGTWAVFQLFYLADDWREIPGKGYRVGWELTTRAQRATLPSGQSARITIEVTGNMAALAVLRKGAFAGADCGGDIAR
jgi:type VI protein secretion system component VasK